MIPKEPIGFPPDLNQHSQLMLTNNLHLSLANTNMLQGESRTATRFVAGEAVRFNQNRSDFVGSQPIHYFGSTNIAASSTQTAMGVADWRSGSTSQYNERANTGALFVSTPMTLLVSLSELIYRSLSSIEKKDTFVCTSDVLLNRSLFPRNYEIKHCMMK